MKNTKEEEEKNGTKNKKTQQSDETEQEIECETTIPITAKTEEKNVFFSIHFNYLP